MAMENIKMFKLLNDVKDQLIKVMIKNYDLLHRFSHFYNRNVNKYVSKSIVIRNPNPWRTISEVSDSI